MTDDPVEWLKRRVGEVAGLEELRDSFTATKPVPEPARSGTPWVQVFMGPDIILTGHVENLSLDRDYIDATVFGDRDTVYLAGSGGRFTITGRQQPLPLGAKHERIG